MRSIGRRGFLQRSVGFAVIPLLAACQQAAPASAPASAPAKPAGSQPQAPAATAAPAAAQAPASRPAASGNPVTLRFLAPRLSEPIPSQKIKELTARFTEANPSITVNLETVPTADAAKKFTTQMTAGDGPDLVEFSTTDFAAYAKAGFLADHTKIIESEGGQKFIDTWEKKFFDMVRGPGGEILGLPIWTATMGLAYNAAWFQQAGLDPAKPPKTWEEFTATAKKLTRDTNNDGKPDQWGVGIYGMRHEIAARYLHVFYWNNGTQIYNDTVTKATLNEPKGIETLTWYTDLAKQGLVGPTFMTNAMQDIYKDWANQKVNMFMVGPWLRHFVRGSVPEMEKALRSTAAPHNGTPAPAPTNGVTMYGMTAQTKQQEAAWKYLTFMSTRDALVEYGLATDFIPPITGALEIPQYKEDPWMRGFVEALPTARQLPTHPRAGDLNLVIADMLQLIWTEKATVQKAADDAAKEIDRILAEK